MECLGDYVAEFKRGPDKKPRKRRANGLVMAGGVTAGGAGLGALGGHAAVDKAHQIGAAIVSSYPQMVAAKAAEKRGEVAKPVVVNKARALKWGKRSRRFTDGVVRQVLKRPRLQKLLKVDKPTRIALKAYSNPGKVGALAGGSLALGGYGAYRAERFVSRRIRGKKL